MRRTDISEEYLDMLDTLGELVSRAKGLRGTALFLYSTHKTNPTYLINNIEKTTDNLDRISNLAQRILTLVEIIKQELNLLAQPTQETK